MARWASRNSSSALWPGSAIAMPMLTVGVRSCPAKTTEPLQACRRLSAVVLAASIEPSPSSSTRNVPPVPRATRLGWATTVASLVARLRSSRSPARWVRASFTAESRSIPTLRTASTPPPPLGWARRSSSSAISAMRLARPVRGSVRRAFSSWRRASTSGWMSRQQLTTPSPAASASAGRAVTPIQRVAPRAVRIRSWALAEVPFLSWALRAAREGWSA